jgi:glutaredoxin 3
MIKVYTTRVCPYCVSAKRFLSQKGWKYEEIDVSNPELRQQISELAGHWRTVPMIFFGSKFVGGYQDMVELDRIGKLAELVPADSL